RARRFVNLDGEGRALCAAERRLVVVDRGITTVLVGDGTLDVLAASLEVGLAWVREGDEIRAVRLPLGGVVARARIPEALHAALAGARRILGAALGPDAAVFGWPRGQVLLRAGCEGGRLRLSPLRLERPLYRLCRIG